MKEGENEGFLPEPTKNGKKYFFAVSDIKEIKKCISKVRRGDFLPYRKETTYQKMKKENEELKKKLAEWGEQNEIH
jgi:hypothetical protein